MVGAANTNGCAKPVRSWPSITTAKTFDLAPAYLTQFPTSKKHEEMTIDVLGPCLLRAQKVNGVATTNENKKAVDSQLMVLSVVPKYVAADVDTGARAIQSHDTTMFKRINWPRPKNLRL